MAFNVAGLSNYSNQESTDLLLQKVTGIKTATYAQKIGNVKSSFALHRLLTTPILQDGTACGFTASGDVQFTDKTLTTYAIKYEDTLCMRTLEAKWTQKLLNSGQNYEDSDIPAVIMSDLYDRIANALETYDWTGTTGANYYDGIATIIDTANLFTQVNNTTYMTGGALASVTESTIDEAKNGMIIAAVKRFPQWMAKSTVKWFVPMEWIAYYAQNLLDKNYFHVKPEDITKGEINIPGTPWNIVGVNGLAGQTKSYMFDTEFLFLGFDASSDETSARLWYSQDNDNHRYSIRMRRGWQHAYPNEVLKFSY